jgi:hypothetical protein
VENLAASGSTINNNTPDFTKEDIPSSFSSQKEDLDDLPF